MAQAEQENSAGEICLIADDDEFFRMALRGILLNQLGCSRVVEAGSLDEAVEQLSEKGPVTLAIFDLAMPGMENAGSLRVVRECFPWTRVALVSASKRRSDILQALEAGVHGYVPKGLGVTELARALQMIREGMIYVPSQLADLPAPEEEPQLGMPGNTTLSSSGLDVGRQPVDLTSRQKDVLELIVKGLTNKEIAKALGVGDGTVKVHVAAIFRTLGVTSRAAAAAAGIRLIAAE
jgi:DNA-binding NarL/FixJ family response regulator